MTNRRTEDIPTRVDTAIHVATLVVSASATAWIAVGITTWREVVGAMGCASLTASAVVALVRDRDGDLS